MIENEIFYKNKKSFQIMRPKHVHNIYVYVYRFVLHIHNNYIIIYIHITWWDTIESKFLQPNFKKILSHSLSDISSTLYHYIISYIQVALFICVYVCMCLCNQRSILKQTRSRIWDPTSLIHPPKTERS